MSVRLLSMRLAKHGRTFLQGFWKRDIHATILEQQSQNRARNRLPTSSSIFQSAAVTQNTAKHALNASLNATASSSGGQAARNSGIFRFGQHARKLFIDNLLNRVTTTYSAGLREQATKKLFYGDSAPFFALVGVSLASGAGVLTKEDELEGVCFEIREAAGRLQTSWNYDDISHTLDSKFNINKLNIGPAIAKGCAAVVYAAEFKRSDVANESVEVLPNMSSCEKTPLGANNNNDVGLADSRLANSSYQPDLLMGPMQNMSRFVHKFRSDSGDHLHVYNQSSAASVFAEALAANSATSLTKAQELVKTPTQESAAILEETQLPRTSKPPAATTASNSVARYPLALKMMFNYDIQSNAMSILRAMYKETVPARQRYMNEAATEWERHVQNQTLTLAPHPNIVCMFGFFCDEVGNFPDGHLLYPIAQPQRINPHGYGRNMSLYLLMKRYDHSLRSLLDVQTLDARTRLLLFAQLLEAVTHTNRHGIAHRDIKSDNILIELNDDKSTPQLVLSDFGCCLADKVHGLQLPYSSYDIDKGGNAALMAPEIINKQPGPFAVLDYAKADLWACGAIAYEIFGLQNPFYSASNGLAAINGEETNSLRNTDYSEGELPPLCDECPALVQQLIYNMLSPNPSKRISPDIAANVMQLFLWAPSHWLKVGGIPNSPEILQWLLSLTTKVMCEARPPNVANASFAAAPIHQLNFQTSGRRTYVEYLLICSFLARARLRRIRGALNWIQSRLN